MKINSFTILSVFSIVSGITARPGDRYKAHDDNDPLNQKSRVTAFVNTDEGLKVQCWEIGDFLPSTQVTRADGSKGTVRQQKMAGNIQITLFSFAPSVTIFSFGTDEVHENAVDFRAKPNLFTVKDGLIFIEALAGADGKVRSKADDWENHVFADVNGDDWFYFEDSTTDNDDRAQCANPIAQSSSFNVRTISGSDTTLINFEYDRTPSHRVLHEGRCNFAGLKPLSTSSRSDPDAGRSRFQSQDL